MSEKIIEISCNNLNEKYTFDKVAKQASGAVLYQVGDAVLLAAIAIDPKPVDEDFLPLTVQYVEKAYAAARIPGGFIKRETKPGDFETLTSRIVDRSLRPLFPKGFHYPVVISITALSADASVDMQVAAMHAASAALFTSDIPVNQAVSAVRLGKIDDEILVNPTLIEQENSTLDLLVVGTGSDILMIEMCVNASEVEHVQQTNELEEDELLEIIDVAQGAIEKATEAYISGFTPVKKEEIEIVLAEDKEDIELYKFIEDNYTEAVSLAVQSMAKSERSTELKKVRQSIMDAL
ncbi:MAG: polyribonucleotide nucleotidyltransferase, partial [Sulfurovaceae bacterium]|nr:polyribonucleotide nucleotidyltransferase [Sulfurovaceae bacterium]